LQHCSPRSLSDNSKWIDHSSRGGRCDIKTPVCRVIRRSDEAFSTYTTLRRCGLTFQIGGRRRDAARIRARQVHSRRLREIEVTRRVPDTAGSRIQPDAPRYAARSGSHCGETFSPLAQSHSQLDKVPRRSPLVSTTTNQNERLLHVLAPKGPAADVARMTR
jgi:hypothetical protein